MAINASLQLTYDTARGKYRTKGTTLKRRVISGSGFGVGPHVEFFTRTIGIPLDLIKKTDPEIGAWEALTSGGGGALARYISAHGRTFFPVRDPLLDHLNGDLSNNNFQTGGVAAITPSEEVFMCGRTTAIPGKRVMGEVTLNSDDYTGGGSLWKPIWFSDYSNGPDADIICGTWSSGSRYIVGNSNTIWKAPSGANIFFPKPNGKLFERNFQMLHGFYQSGLPSSPVAMDSVVEAFQFDSTGLWRQQYLADPYYGTPRPTVTQYKKFFYNAYFGQSPNDYVNMNMGMTDFYIATGANARARVILSDSPTLVACTADNSYILPPISWSDTEIAVDVAPWEDRLYSHIIISDGTAKQNQSITV